MVKLQILLNVFMFSCTISLRGNKDNKKLKCGNCVTIPNFRNDDVGFDCSMDDMAITLTTSRRRQGTIKGILPECLPPKFHIIGSISEYCCFWSPRLGCTQVYGELYLEKFSDNCSVCAHSCGRVNKAIVESFSIRVIDQEPIFIYFLPLFVINCQ